MIAEACGVSKALMYHYYSSKDAVLFDLLQDHLQNLVAVVEAAAQSAGRPEEKLFAISEALLEAYRGADAEHQVQISSLKLLPPAQQESLKEMERKLVVIVSDAIADAIPHVAKKTPSAETAHHVAVRDVELALSVVSRRQGHYAREICADGDEPDPVRRRGRNVGDRRTHCDVESRAADCSKEIARDLTFNRHPEEPRACAASRRMGHKRPRPSFETRVQEGTLLRMTAFENYRLGSG